MGFRSSPAPLAATWPTDASVNAHRAVDPALTDHIPFEVTRARLRAAMLADPIIQAAIAWRDQSFPDGEAGLNSALYPQTCNLVSALAKAGL